MIEKWALEHPEIHFSNMHPGWVDTPAARKGLGEFYEKMKEKFRDPCEGADTVIWLAISKPALSIKSGSFFQGTFSNVFRSFSTYCSLKWYYFYFYF